MLIDLAGKGRFHSKEMPEKLKNIEMGSAEVDDKKLRDFVGDIRLADIKDSLKKTMEYFKGRT